MNNKISVFGGTGFIGSKFCEMYKDIVYIEPRESNVPKYDDVLYLISTTDNYNVFTDVHLDINTNLNKLMNVLPNVKGLFTYVSSWFVYGDGPIPAKEEQYCNPKGFYSITKKCAEDLIISYCQTYNKNYKIFRLSNVYGNNDKGVSKKKNALQYLINEIKNNNNINLYYDGNFIRDYLHVEDACNAIKLCLTTSEQNQIINIGSGIPQNFREIIEFVINELKSNNKITSVDAPEFHKIVQVKDMYLDVSKLKYYGFKQKIDIYKGIASIL